LVLSAAAKVRPELIVPVDSGPSSPLAMSTPVTLKLLVLKLPPKLPPPPPPPPPPAGRAVPAVTEDVAHCHRHETAPVLGTMIATAGRALRTPGHRDRVPWCTTKTPPSTADMAAKLRRVVIAARFKASRLDQLASEEISTLRLAWEDFAA
jgi:hypothetical protein